MAIRRGLALLALLVLAVGVPVAYGAAFMDAHHLTFGTRCLLVSLPPLVALGLSGISIVPSRTVPHSTRGDVVSVFVGSASFWLLLAGLTFVVAVVVV